MSPLLAPILYAFQQAREDLARLTEGLTTEQIWARPHGFGPVGFHLRHIAGSVERLMTYVQGRPAQPRSNWPPSTAEMEPGATRDELLAELERLARTGRGDRARASIRRRWPSRAASAASSLPTTVIGLLTHIAEHTQRHVGEAICAAKLARVS